MALIQGMGALTQAVISVPCRSRTSSTSRGGSHATPHPPQISWERIMGGKPNEELNFLWRLQLPQPHPRGLIRPIRIHRQEPRISRLGRVRTMVGGTPSPAVVESWVEGGISGQHKRGYIPRSHGSKGIKVPRTINNDIL
ncbi:General substrate transporter [Sesbania bispinosa]|nr:General substrate transporter [Sesbania bispinosa]